jgi:hypothetical protein
MLFWPFKNSLPVQYRIIRSFLAWNYLKSRIGLLYNLDMVLKAFTRHYLAFDLAWVH